MAENSILCDKIRIVHMKRAESISQIFNIHLLLLIQLL